MWLEKEKKYLVQLYRRQKVVVERGEGCYVYDINGKKYLDLVAGIACINIGHSDQEFVKRVCEQLSKLTHVSNLFYTIPQIQLAEKLHEITGMDKFFFCNSGTESVEAALKFSRKATGRRKFVSFTNSFHGRTMGSLSVTYKERFRKPFEPLIQQVDFVKFNDPEDFKQKIDRDVAAVILELVQGEAGVYPAEKEFLKTIFDLKSEYGYLVIFDEVQTGFGRTGKWFAKDHYKLQPDIMTMAKAMGNGIPIGCTAVKEEVAKSLEAGDHASTFGGNPVSCTAAIAVIDIIEKRGLIENAQKVGGYLKKRLKEISGDVRGIGLLIGFSIKNALNLVEKCLEKGLFINATSENNVRLAPPLCINEDEVDLTIKILKEVIES